MKIAKYGGLWKIIDYFNVRSPQNEKFLTLFDHFLTLFDHFLTLFYHF